MKSFGLSRNDAEVGDHWGKRIKGATEYSNKPGLHGNGRKNINSHYVTFFTDDIELHRKYYCHEIVNWVSLIIIHINKIVVWFVVSILAVI